MSRHVMFLGVVMATLPLVACGSDPPPPTQVIVQAPPAAPVVVPAPAVPVQVVPLAPP